MMAGSVQIMQGHLSHGRNTSLYSECSGSYWRPWVQSALMGSAVFTGDSGSWKQGTRLQVAEQCRQ